MKKILAGACLFGLLLSACTPAAEPGDDGTLHILATTYPVYLKGGESFVGRVIYGIDYLHAQQETDVNEEPNPFSAFGFGL